MTTTSVQPGYNRNWHEVLVKAAKMAQKGELTLTEAASQKIVTAEEVERINALRKKIEEGSTTLYPALSEIIASYDDRGNLSSVISEKAKELLNTIKERENIDDFFDSTLRFYP